MKIYIPIATYNRLELAKISLENLCETVKSSPHEVKIEVYDDMSVYDASKEFSYLNMPIKPLKQKAGIHVLRVFQLWEFLNKHTEYDFVYLTDPDVIHDPDWLDEGLRLMTRYNNPVCLYNTLFHDLWGTWQNWEVSCRQYAPGVSLLLSRDMVKSLFPEAGKIQTEWDFKIDALLGNEIIVSRKSYLDHYGQKSGMHVSGNWDRDHAINPTPYLNKLRFEMIPKLEALKV